MSLAVSTTAVSTEPRFKEVEVDGEWTVRDASRQAQVEHQAPWDQGMAREVAEGLNVNPRFAHIYTWVSW